MHKNWTSSFFLGEQTLWMHSSPNVPSLPIQSPHPPPGDFDAHWSHWPDVSPPLISAQLQQILQISPESESQTNLVTAAMSPVLGYTSWKYSHHGNTAQIPPSDTMRMWPVSPGGNRSVHTNMYLYKYWQVFIFWYLCPMPMKKDVDKRNCVLHWIGQTLTSFLPDENIVVLCSHCSPPCWCKHQHFNSSVGGSQSRWLGAALSL